MTTKGALIAAMAAGFFSASTPLVVCGGGLGQGPVPGRQFLQGQERLPRRQQRLRGSELVQGQGLDPDDREGVQGQGRQDRQVADRQPSARSATLQPARNWKSRSRTTCFSTRSTRKARPSPTIPLNVSRYQTSSAQRTWPLSHGRRPLRRLEIAEARRADAALSAQLAERRRRAHDVDGARRRVGLDLPPPLADQAQPRRAAAQIGLGFVGFVRGQPGEVGDVELREQILGADLAQPRRVRLLQLALALGRVVGVEPQHRVARRNAGDPSRRSRCRPRSPASPNGISGGMAAAIRARASMRVNSPCCTRRG